MSFFDELKRRNVFRAGIAYAITAWLIAQIAGLAATSFFAPDWVMKMIITVLILGFPVAMVMAWAYEMTPEGLRRDDGDAPSPANTSKLDRTITIALIAALAYFAYDKFVIAPEREAAIRESVSQQVSETGETQDSAPAETVESDRSIAVLPFVNMSDDSSNEYFSEGLSEELLNLLVKIPELKVAARTSSFSYKGKDTKIAQIGEELQVAHVLEGSVRKSGNQVRITAQLIKADDGFHLWSETYDRTLDDIFVIQDEIASAVVQSLKVTLLGTVLEHGTENPEAFALYLQGKFFNDLADPDSLKKALEVLKEAVSIDPEFAPAWVELNLTYHFMARARVMPEKEASILALEAVHKALEVDPEYAFAWSSLGYLKRTYEWDWEGAEEAIEKAMQLEPNSAEVMGSAGSVANSLGQRDKAIKLFERKKILDPVSLPGLRALVSLYISAARFDDALLVMDQLRSINPDHLTLPLDRASIHLFQGNFDEALREAELSQILGVKDFYRANFLFRAGRTAEAQEVFDQLLVEKLPVATATVYTAKGDKDAAFEWLETAFQEHDSNLTFILNNFWFRELHDDPRWEDLLDKMGLLEYWRLMPEEYKGPSL
jgi:TolB-like protein/Flp pilus assembly protein TadD